MKRLFKVRVDGKWNYYQRKEEAKEVRDDTGATKVCLGPDHMGKHGNSSKRRKNKVRV